MILLKGIAVDYIGWGVGVICVKCVKGVVSGDCTEW